AVRGRLPGAAERRLGGLGTRVTLVIDRALQCGYRQPGNRRGGGNRDLSRDRLTDPRRELFAVQRVAVGAKRERGTPGGSGVPPLVRVPDRLALLQPRDVRLNF